MSEPTAEEKGAASIPPEWLAEFEAAARRPLATRFRYAFAKTYKPVLECPTILQIFRWEKLQKGAPGICFGESYAAWRFR